jgi:septal ring factor EnvC (AmiA/AmiB activator)
MKFNTIAYERSRKRYEDVQTIRVELTVEEEEDPVTVMQLAQAFVDNQLGIRIEKTEQSIGDLKNQESSLKSKVASLEQKVTEAKERWEKVKAFLIQHGVSAENFEADLPF